MQPQAAACRQGRAADARCLHIRSNMHATSLTFISVCRAARSASSCVELQIGCMFGCRADGCDVRSQCALQAMNSITVHISVCKLHPADLACSGSGGKGSTYISSGVGVPLEKLLQAYLSAAGETVFTAAARSDPSSSLTPAVRASMSWHGTWATRRQLLWPKVRSNAVRKSEACRAY
jgi:hypothetical protein